MRATNASTQLDDIKRIKDLVEKAKQVLGDSSSLDVLEGLEAKNLDELQAHLIDASACLRALVRQLKERADSELQS